MRREGPAEQTWSAPGRVNLIGDHTDYNEGLALPFALPLRTVVHVRHRRDGLIRARSTGHQDVTFSPPGQPGAVTGWGAYVAGVAWALHRSGLEIPGADLSISSDVPVGAGLSSSHSLECAVGLALCAVAGHDLDRTELATVIQTAENDYVGAPTGLLDQMAVLHSVPDHLSFFDARALTVEPVPARFTDHGLALLVIDTNAPHQHVDGAYAERRQSCEEAARRLGVRALRDVDDVDAALAALGDDVVMRRARYVLGESSRVLHTVELVRAGRLAEVGPILTESHEAARLDFENTVPEVDLAVSTAVAAGALGARMTGGGFGGAVVALVKAAHVEQVEQAVTRAFAGASFAPASFLPVTPARGAGRGT